MPADSPWICPKTSEFLTHHWPQAGGCLQSQMEPVLCQWGQVCQQTLTLKSWFFFPWSHHFAHAIGWTRWSQRFFSNLVNSGILWWHLQEGFFSGICLGAIQGKGSKSTAGGFKVDSPTWGTWKVDVRDEAVPIHMQKNLSLPRNKKKCFQFGYFQLPWHGRWM